MALNFKNHETLIKNILPEIEFRVSTAGITVISQNRLDTPRYLPFDSPGRCKECRGTEVEIDFIVTKKGVTVYCSKIRGSRFVEFDQMNDLPGYCFFKIKNKARVFNVEHGTKPCADFADISSSIPKNDSKTADSDNQLAKNSQFLSTISQISTLLDLIIPSEENLKKLGNEIKEKGGEKFEEFLNLILAASSFISPAEREDLSDKISEQQIEQFNSHKMNLENSEIKDEQYQNLINILSAALTFVGLIPLNKIKKENEEKLPLGEDDQIKGVNDFFQSLSAATFGLPANSSAEGNFEKMEIGEANEEEGEEEEEG